MRPTEGAAISGEEQKVDLFERLELSESEATRLSDASLVERLVESGTSRLTAERMVEIERGAAELGRARPHGGARR